MAVTLSQSTLIANVESKVSSSAAPTIDKQVYETIRNVTIVACFLKCFTREWFVEYFNDWR